MSWHFLPELAGGSSAGRSSVGKPLQRSRSTRSAGRCYCDDSSTACFPCSRSGTTRERSEAGRGAVESMWSRLGSRVSRSAWRERERERLMRATSGPTPSGSFARFRHGSRSWRTCQGSLLIGISDVYSGTWPRSGTMRNGACSERTMSAPPTSGTDCGSWPTPRSEDSQCAGVRHSRGVADTLYARVVKWPTPRAVEWKGTGPVGSKSHAHRLARGYLDATVAEAESRGGTGTRRTWGTPRASAGGQDRARATRTTSDGGFDLVTQVGASLNPDWVEWLMGWPIGWTGLKQLATGRFRQWRRSHGGFS